MSAGLIWFLIGVGFLILELCLPGFVLIFFCFGSWVAALIAALWPSVGWSWGIAIFLAFSLIALVTLRKLALRIFRGRKSGTPEDESRDEFEEELRGKTAVVTKEVAPAAGGEVKFRGSFWRAVASAPIAEGATVRIVGRATEDGLTLEVTPFENNATRKE
jgi:inner membrane protein